MMQNFTLLIQRISAVLLLITLSSNLAVSQVFWSETFDSGIPSSWSTFDNDSDFNWEATDVGPQGPYAIDPLHEAGSGETWIIYDSDLDCSGSQDAWITSDAIDCSSAPVVWMGFDQVYRDFYDSTYVVVSTDNVNWTFFNVNGEAAPNDSGAASILIDISAVAAGQSTVYIGFNYLSTAATQPSNLAGCGYSWQVDNIELTDEDPRPANDMRVNDNFYAIAPSVITPLSQVEAFGFLADIENVGGETQTSVNLNISIVDNDSGDEVYTEDLAYGMIESDSLAENVPFASAGFTPPAQLGTYTGTYTVSADETDGDESNNTQSFDFFVSDDFFAKEVGATIPISPATSNWDPGEALSWAYGNYFYVPNGSEFAATEASFGLFNADELEGQSVTLWLYKWTDDGDELAQQSERERVGFGVYEIQGDEGFDIISVPLFNFLDQSLGVPLEDNTPYILMAEYVGLNDQTTMVLLGSDEFDYGAQILRSREIGTPRFGSLLGIGDDTEDYSTLGFGYDLVPVVRFSIEEIVSTEEALTNENLVDIFPNPTKDVVNIQVDLEETTSEMMIQIYSVDGKQLMTQSYEAVKAGTFTINVQDLTAGTYLMNIITDAGNRTKRFMIQQ